MTAAAAAAAAAEYGRYALHRPLC